MKTLLLNNWLMIFLLVLTGLITTNYGCKNNDPVEEVTGGDTIGIIDTIKEKPVYPLDTAHINAILGKWVSVAMGNWPYMESIVDTFGYLEFLPDSILLNYDYKTNNVVFVKKYWFDSLLHEGIYVEDGFWLTISYYFQFYNDSLRLDYADLLATYRTSIFKKLK